MHSFEDIYADMKHHRMKLPGPKVDISIPHARIIFEEAMQHFLQMEGRKMIWLPEYEEVISWLTNNYGKGLFLYGNCGRGKSLLCRYVLPAILLQHCRKVVSVFDIQDMNKDIDHVLSRHLITLDDIGTEEVSVKYGERRTLFAEVMDAAEKCNKLIIISTNLSAAQLGQRYGDRVVERIKSTTRRIAFNGRSLRV